MSVRPDLLGWGRGWPTCEPGRRIISVVAGANQVRLPVDERLGFLVAVLVNGLEQRRGFPFNPAWCWGGMCRPIAGTSSPSFHSWFTAVDLDAPTNPMRRPFTSNMPPDTAAFAASLGFRWGGLYTGTPDPMHFEFVQTPAWAAARTAQLATAIKKAAGPKEPKMDAPPPGLNAPIVDGAADPDGKGYYRLGADGGVFTGGATFYGSAVGLIERRDRAVGIATSRTRKGYWVATAKGGVFTFRPEKGTRIAFHGSLGGKRLTYPIVAIEATESGKGYWLFAADGGTFAFGDATFHGGAPGGS